MNPPESPAARTICLVDDDTSVLKAVGRLLTSAGWVVRAFSEAVPFLAYISTNRVDLVVLDIWMKQMTGLEVLARLCSLSPQTRFIILTGREDPAVELIATQIGAVGFFLKPFDDEKFLAAVHRALGTSAGCETKVQ
jgi:Response regulator containing CheY-like receiver, AAA-type ATPase, and DNA-binding domains